MKKKIKELKTQMRELQAKMADIVDDPEKAEEFDQLERDFRAKQAELETLNEELRERRENHVIGAGARLRELLAGQRNGTQEREVTLGDQGVDSGAIPLTIMDLVPALQEGNTLPQALTVVTGVTGNVVYPTGSTGVELEEAAEVATLNDQVIDFDKVNVTPHRVTLSCDVSNSMIDNWAFDILAYVQDAYNKAWIKYLALKTYSQAKFSGNKGGFSGLASSGTITLGAGTAYKDILKAVAEFTDKGFSESGLCITIDAVTEAELKMEPKQKGVAGYVIEDGKLCGYDYTVSGKINTVLGGDAKTDAGNTDETKLYKTTKRYLGIGYYEYLKVQQHGDVRLTMDATSKAIAKKNCVNMTLNTEFSFTDLSNHIYDEQGEAVKAFAIYDLA